MPKYDFDTIKIGDSARFCKTVTEKDVKVFAEVTGDKNRIHLCVDFAKDTKFKKPIVHGMLLGGFISTLLGNYLPGTGTIYISQNIRFLAPVYVGESVTAEVEVIDKNNDKKRIILKTIIYNQSGKVVVDGEAVVKPPHG